MVGDEFPWSAGVDLYPLLWEYVVSSFLRWVNRIFTLQHAYPRAGRFRIHGLLGQQREEPPRVSARWGAR